MPLTTLVAGQTARAGDVNDNFALCVLTDTARTVTATHTWAPQTFAGGTVTTSTPVLDITQTWNAAVAFTGLKFNVTDTSSLAASGGVIGSLLLDLQIGGASKFAVTKAGSLLTGGVDVALDNITSVTAGAGNIFANQAVRAYRAAATPDLAVVHIAGSFASPSAIGSGVTIGTFGFGASTSATTTSNPAVDGGAISAVTTEAWSTTANGMKLVFATIPNTTAIPVAALTLDQDKTATFGGNLVGPASWSLTGGAGNMTILAGTGNSRTLILRATNGSGTATTNVTLSDTTAVFNSIALSGITTLAMGGALSGVTTLATSSTINSQTISASANFTGSLTVATTLSITGSGPHPWASATGRLGINLPSGQDGATIQSFSDLILQADYSAVGSNAVKMYRGTTFVASFATAGAQLAAGLALSAATIPSHGIQFGSSAPGTLADGQMWFDGTDFKVRHGGATKTVTVA